MHKQVIAGLLSLCRVKKKQVTEKGKKEKKLSGKYVSHPKEGKIRVLQMEWISLEGWL